VGKAAAEKPVPLLANLCTGVGEAVALSDCAWTAIKGKQNSAEAMTNFRIIPQMR
jgi:hypothetical protein